MAMLAPVFQIIRGKIVKKLLRAFRLNLQIIKQRKNCSLVSITFQLPKITSELMVVEEITAHEQRSGRRG